jgi:hypothetical protein
MEIMEEVPIQAGIHIPPGPHKPSKHVMIYQPSPIKPIRNTAIEEQRISTNCRTHKTNKRATLWTTKRLKYPECCLLESFTFLLLFVPPPSRWAFVHQPPLIQPTRNLSTFYTTADLPDRESLIAIYVLILLWYKNVWSVKDEWIDHDFWVYGINKGVTQRTIEPLNMFGMQIVWMRHFLVSWCSMTDDDLSQFDPQ